MFTAVFLAVICTQQMLGAVAVEMHELRVNMQACMDETGSTTEEILAWADGADASENLKCQMKCIMMRTHSMTEDGRFVLEPMLAMMPQEQHAVVSKCAEIEQAGTELCDLAYRHQKCLRDKAPEFYAGFVKEKTASP